MQKFFIFADTISLAIILGIFFVNRKKGGEMGAGQMNQFKNKKF